MAHCPHEVIVRVIDRLGLMEDRGYGPVAPVLETHHECQSCRRHVVVTNIVDQDNAREVVAHAGTKIGEAMAAIANAFRKTDEG